MRQITRAKVHHARGAAPADPATFRAAKDAMSRLSRVYVTENVARCHRCPPHSSCATCAGLNKARIQIGLIQPRYTDDHRNNILYGTPISKSASVRDQHRDDARSRRPGPVITACIKQLGGGWRRGRAMLNGEVIYEGEPTRSMDEAWAFANKSKASIAEGVAFERMLEDM
jgi:hypothetical protein